ncbi:uncharacterized protein LOC104874631 isoform X1 [Fukomys damarensis]|uniref:uncharacterized protein LOC104874631 isoform X1 n=1 Tax=Fukomys damarensis TaxID=885580 RepID=UPI0014555968|nr:uncharacterized protein LOC104874631 isoform X1 [Fukomys damarensis]
MKSLLHQPGCRLRSSASRDGCSSHPSPALARAAVGCWVWKLALGEAELIWELLLRGPALRPRMLTKQGCFLPHFWGDFLPPMPTLSPETPADLSPHTGQDPLPWLPMFSPQISTCNEETENAGHFAKTTHTAGAGAAVAGPDTKGAGPLGCSPTAPGNAGPRARILRRWPRATEGETGKGRDAAQEGRLHRPLLPVTGSCTHVQSSSPGQQCQKLSSLCRKIHLRAHPSIPVPEPNVPCLIAE